MRFGAKASENIRGPPLGSRMSGLAFPSHVTILGSFLSASVSESAVRPRRRPLQADGMGWDVLVRYRVLPRQIIVSARIASGFCLYLVLKSRAPPFWPAESRHLNTSQMAKSAGGIVTCCCHCVYVFVLFFCCCFDVTVINRCLHHHASTPATASSSWWLPLFSPPSSGHLENLSMCPVLSAHLPT